MPLYRYTAVNEKGKRKTGSIGANSLHDAKIKLIQLKIAAIRIDPLSAKEVSSSLTKKELLAVTRELHRLLQAGLPLYEALSGLEEKYRGQKLHRLLLDLCDRVRAGENFSSALAQHPKTFDLLYIAMVANAESTGRLHEALGEIASLLTHQVHLRKQVVTALLYPSLLSVFCLAVLSTLLFFVITSLRELFEGRELHPFTRFVFACSEFAVGAKYVLFCLLLAWIGMMIYLTLTSKGRVQVSRLLSQLPWVRHVYAKIALVRFCRATAALLEGGVAAVSALAQGRKVMRHPALEKIVAGAEQKLMQGEPLHTSFEGHPLVPPLVPRMFAIAQQSGKLSFMMKQIAQIYEEELEAMFNQLSAIAQPLLLLLLGGLVGFVLLSVLLPLTDVSSFVT